MSSSYKSYSIKTLRKFAVVFSLGFVIIFGIIPYLRHPGSPFNHWVLILFISSSLVAVFRPYMLRRPYLAWIKLGTYLASLNSRLILGLFFYFVISPIGVCARIFRSVVAFLKPNAKSSYRVSASQQISTFSDQH